MRGWNAKTIDWYLRAGEHSQYPRKILAEILPELRPYQRVLDIGCGPGLWALAMAPQVAEILALDRQSIVLDILDSLTKQRGLTNIHSQRGNWPQIEVDNADVVLSAFSSGGVMNSPGSIQKMLDLQPEAIYLVAPGKYSPPFAWKPHADHHPDANLTLEILGKMDIAYSQKLLEVDFGQPVRDEEEAAEFLAGFLNISREKAWRHGQRIARPHPAGLYLPNPRNVVLITIQTK